MKYITATKLKRNGHGQRIQTLAPPKTKPRKHRFFYCKKPHHENLLNAFNACICGLGEVAAFVRVFAQKVTVYPSPARCTGYTLFDFGSLE